MRYAQFISGGKETYMPTTLPRSLSPHNVLHSPSNSVLHIILSCHIPHRSGVVMIDGQLVFSLVSALTANPPVFTLTCVSTGGPATTVTWTRDGAAATGAASQNVTSTLTATYVNTLTVTGRLPGSYQCSVANVRTAPPATASLTVAGE